MGTEDSDIEFKAAFLARVKETRERKGWTQAQMARLLGLEQGTYHKYEVRTIMPLPLLRRFCLETGADIGDLMWGNRLPTRVRRRA